MAIIYYDYDYDYDNDYDYDYTMTSYFLHFAVYLSWVKHDNTLGEAQKVTSVFWSEKLYF